ncbi:MAG: type II secretion system protein GspC [Myxococcota bacterium]
MSAVNTWTIAGIFLGVGLIGWLGAMGTTRIASGYLALPEDATLINAAAGGAVIAPTGGDDGPAAPERPPRSPRAKSKNSYVDPIVARSIFDSSKIGAVAEEAVVTGDERKSNLKVVLLATIVAEPSAYSSALMAEDKSSPAAGYGIDDDLLGEATIVAIEPKKVIIKRTDGTIEYIAMGEDGGKSEPVAAKSSSREPDPESGVSKVGDNKYVVDQDTFDRLLENPEQLYTQVRVVPHKNKDGEIDGYRLSGIRRKSFFYQLGVKNGDIVHSVNGKPLTSMSAAMDAYNSLTSSREFSFDLTRRNKQQTFDYEVR